MAPCARYMRLVQSATTRPWSAALAFGHTSYPTKDTESGRSPVTTAAQQKTVVQWLALQVGVPPPAAHALRTAAGFLSPASLADTGAAQPPPAAAPLPRRDAAPRR